jgi:hypothetical protein
MLSEVPLEQFFRSEFLHFLLLITSKTIVQYSSITAP